MKLACFREVVDVTTVEELRQQLGLRHEGVFGSFWLWHEAKTEFALMINGEDAYVHFFAGDGSAGYQAAVREGNEDIMFLATNYEQTWMPRYTTLSLVEAVTAIEEFFRSGRRPVSVVRWAEL